MSEERLAFFERLADPDSVIAEMIAEARRAKASEAALREENAKLRAALEEAQTEVATLCGEAIRLQAAVVKAADRITWLETHAALALKVASERPTKNTRRGVLNGNPTRACRVCDRRAQARYKKARAAKKEGKG